MDDTLTDARHEAYMAEVKRRAPIFSSGRSDISERMEEIIGGATPEDYLSGLSDEELASEEATYERIKADITELWAGEYTEAGDMLTEDEIEQAARNIMAYLEDYAS